jgi:tRNA dimethylallyltransferase
MRARITTRVYERMDQGAIEECRSLLSRGYSFDAPGLRTIGYTSLFSFLRGECTQEYAVQEWITAEYRYAKRQSTYFLKYFPHAIRQYV